MSDKQGLTEQESITESDKVRTPAWKPEEVWDRIKDSEQTIRDNRERDNNNTQMRGQKGSQHQILNNKLCWASKSQWVTDQESQNKSLNVQKFNSVQKLQNQAAYWGPEYEFYSGASRIQL